MADTLAERKDASGGLSFADDEREALAKACLEYGELPSQLGDVRGALVQFLIQSRPSVVNPYTGKTEPVQFDGDFAWLCADAADLVMEVWTENMRNDVRTALRIMADQ